MAAILGLPLQRRTLATRLILVREVDAVFAAHLGGRAADVHLAALRLACREAVVPDPVPARQVAGIRVGDNPLHGCLGVQLSDAAIEPQAVTLNRSAVQDTLAS